MDSHHEGNMALHRDKHLGMSRLLPRNSGDSSHEQQATPDEEAAAIESAKQLHVHQPGIVFVPGAKLQVQETIDNNWYNCKVVEVDWGELDILVHYQRWSDRFNEWLKMDSKRIRPAPADKCKESCPFHVGDRVLALWAPDQHMYPARVTKVLSSQQCEVLFVDNISRVLRCSNISRVSAKGPPEREFPLTAATAAAAAAGAASSLPALVPAAGNTRSAAAAAAAATQVVTPDGSKKSIFEVEICDQKRKPKRKAEFVELFDNIKKRKLLQSPSAAAAPHRPGRMLSPPPTSCLSSTSVIATPDAAGVMKADTPSIPTILSTSEGDTTATVKVDVTTVAKNKAIALVKADTMFEKADATSVAMADVTINDTSDLVVAGKASSTDASRSAAYPAVVTDSTQHDHDTTRPYKNTLQRKSHNEAPERVPQNVIEVVDVSDSPLKSAKSSGKFSDTVIPISPKVSSTTTAVSSPRQTSLSKVTSMSSVMLVEPATSFKRSAINASTTLPPHSLVVSAPSAKFSNTSSTTTTSVAPTSPQPVRVMGPYPRHAPGVVGPSVQRGLKQAALKKQHKQHGVKAANKPSFLAGMTATRRAPMADDCMHSWEKHGCNVVKFDFFPGWVKQYSRRQPYTGQDSWDVTYYAPDGSCISNRRELSSYAEHDALPCLVASFDFSPAGVEETMLLHMKSCSVGAVKQPFFAPISSVSKQKPPTALQQHQKQAVKRNHRSESETLTNKIQHIDSSKQSENNDLRKTPKRGRETRSSGVENPHALEPEQPSLQPKSRHVTPHRGRKPRLSFSSQSSVDQEDVAEGTAASGQEEDEDESLVVSPNVAQKRNADGASVTSGAPPASQTLVPKAAPHPTHAGHPPRVKIEIPINPALGRVGVEGSVTPQQRSGGGRRESVSSDFIIGDLEEHVCFVKDCGKTFRKYSLLQMHLKHYHPNTGTVAAPNVADLAYARTVEGRLLTPSTPRHAQEQRSKRCSVSEASEPKRRRLDRELLPFRKSVASMSDALLEKDPVASTTEASVDSGTEDVTLPVDDRANETGQEKLLTVKPLLCDSGSDEEEFMGFPASSPSKQSQGGRAVAAAAAEAEDSSSSGDDTDAADATTTTTTTTTDVADDGDEGYGHDIIHCRCGSDEEDGLMLQCDVCLCWQHAACYDIDKRAVPEKYVCSMCSFPRLVRSGHKWGHHANDWLKEAFLPKLSFSTTDGAIDSGSSDRVQRLVRRGHDLAAALLQHNAPLHALNVALAMAKKPDHPKLVMWHKKWPDRRSPDARGTSSVLPPPQDLVFPPALNRHGSLTTAGQPTYTSEEEAALFCHLINLEPLLQPPSVQQQQQPVTAACLMPAAVAGDAVEAGVQGCEGAAVTAVPGPMCPDAITDAVTATFTDMSLIGGSDGCSAHDGATSEAGAVDNADVTATSLPQQSAHSTHSKTEATDVFATDTRLNDSVDTEIEAMEVCLSNVTTKQDITPKESQNSENQKSFSESDGLLTSQAENKTGMDVPSVGEERLAVAEVSLLNISTSIHTNSDGKPGSKPLAEVNDSSKTLKTELPCSSVGEFPLIESDLLSVVPNCMEAAELSLLVKTPEKSDSSLNLHLSISSDSEDVPEAKSGAMLVESLNANNDTALDKKSELNPETNVTPKKEIKRNDSLDSDVCSQPKKESKLFESSADVDSKPRPLSAEHSLDNVNSACNAARPSGTQLGSDTNLPGEHTANINFGIPNIDVPLDANDRDGNVATPEIPDLNNVENTRYSKSAETCNSSENSSDFSSSNNLVNPFTSGTNPSLADASGSLAETNSNLSAASINNNSNNNPTVDVPQGSSSSHNLEVTETLDLGDNTDLDASDLGLDLHDLLTSNPSLDQLVMPALTAAAGHGGQDTTPLLQGNNVPSFPEAERIEPVSCKLNMLSHVQAVQDTLELAYDNIERQIRDLEGELGLSSPEDEEDEDDTAADVSCRQLVQMVLQDMTVVRRLARYTGR